MAGIRIILKISATYAATMIPRTRNISTISQSQSSRAHSTWRQSVSGQSRRLPPHSFLSLPPRRSLWCTGCAIPFLQWQGRCLWRLRRYLRKGARERMQGKKRECVFQTSGISLTGTRTSLNGRTMELIRELKMQDTNSYRYLLMEDMLFTTAEELSRKLGTPEEIVTEYLKELYRKKE